LVRGGIVTSTHHLGIMHPVSGLAKRLTEPVGCFYSDMLVSRGICLSSINLPT
jgi:hypothetical protein